MDCIYMMQSKQDICVEPLERCGDGKNMEKKEKNYFNALALSCKSFVFPWETLLSLAKPQTFE